MPNQLMLELIRKAEKENDVIVLAQDRMLALLPDIRDIQSEKLNGKM